MMKPKIIKISIKTILLVFLFFIKINNGFAQTSDSILTIDKCIQLSIENNEKIKIAKLESEKMQYRYKQNKGIGLPQLNAGGVFENYFSLPTLIIPGEIFGTSGTSMAVEYGTKYSTIIGLEASQIIYNQSYLASIKLFRTIKEISDLEVQKNIEDIVYNVSQLYIIIQSTAKQIELLDSNLVTLDKLKNLATTLYNSGFVKVTDVDVITVAQNNAEVQKENLKILSIQQQEMLKFLLGIDFNFNVTPIDSNIENFFFRDSISGTPIDLLILDKQIQLAGYNLTLTKANYFPSLTAFAKFNYQSQIDQFQFGNSDNWNKITMVGLKLEFPFFDGMQKKFKKKHDWIDYKQASLAKEAALRSYKSDLLRTKDKLERNILIVEKQKSNIKLAEKNFRIFEDQYKNGLKPLSEVLNAKTEMNVAKISMLQAVMELKLANLELGKNYGNLLKYK